jgi:hypothetical protein
MLIKCVSQKNSDMCCMESGHFSYSNSLVIDCFLWFTFRHFSTETLKIIQNEIRVVLMSP